MIEARIGAAGLGVATALLFAACGNGPPPGSGGGGGAGGGGNVGSKTSGAAAAATVKETDALKFDPSSSNLKVGDVIEWDNASGVAHNVTFDDFSSITSDTMNSGDKYQVKFTKAGTYQYHCTFHPGMDASITVSG